MAYRYETHMHTSQASACGRATGSEQARFYKEAGYQGIIVTDHFFGGNTAVPPQLPWRERIEWFCSGYEDALATGQRIGLDVFFGWEQCFERDEYLVYGLDKAWLLRHPEMERWTRAEQLEQVHREGGCVIQAHPFRDRAYIPRILLGPDYADGIEVANASNRPYNDAYAHRYARALGLFTIAGSDNHQSGTGCWTADQVLGVETEERLADMRDFAARVRDGRGLRPILPPGRFDVDPNTAPRLESYWLDETESAVPTGRDWLRE